jgi:hypothetical protein
LIYTCPNKDFARAICTLLETAKRAQGLMVLDAVITSNCYLAPKILADGSLAMVASLFDEAVWKDGEQVAYDKLDLELGTPEYEQFAQQFLSEPGVDKGSDDE